LRGQPHRVPPTGPTGCFPRCRWRKGFEYNAQ
jgi:hypothetical protein